VLRQAGDVDPAAALVDRQAEHRARLHIHREARHPAIGAARVAGEVGLRAGMRHQPVGFGPGAKSGWRWRRRRAAAARIGTGAEQAALLAGAAEAAEHLQVARAEPEHRIGRRVANGG
jgi:hypothetical protein